MSSRGALRRKRRAPGTGSHTPEAGGLARFFSHMTHVMLRRAVRLYYPRIDVGGRDRIPSSGPVLYVANHANSLIDPVIINIVAGRPVHFLAKAPLFEMPIFGPLMRALGMIPAYRGVDDRAQVKRNLESLGAAAALLAKGKAIGLFPEGKSHDALHVDQVRTGTARIALQAIEQGANELKIVPLGINYERKERFRSAVWVEVGEPIDPVSRTAQPQQNEASGEAEAEPRGQRRLARDLTVAIEQGLKSTVIHLDDPQWEPLLEDVEVLLPEMDAQRSRPESALRLRKQVAEAMNYFMATEPQRTKPLADAISEHHRQLDAAGLTMNSPVLRYRGWKLMGRLIWHTLRLTIGIVPMVAGTVHHLVPFLIVRLVASRFQQPGRTTIALMRLLFGLPVYGAWYVLVWWWIAWQFPAPNNWVAWTWTALMPLAGIFAFSYWYRARDAATLWWHQLRALWAPRRLELLRRDQEQIVRRIGAMADAYQPGDTPRR